MPTGKLKRRPGTSIEERENQLISLAVDLAEQQLRDGTASAQVISHYLKLGSTKEKLEKEILSNQNELLKAKTSAIRSGESYKEDMDNAMKALASYSGDGNEYEDV